MKYELMVIIKPLLPEDIKSKVLKNMEEFLSKNSGKIEKTDIWGKRHLAYKIKGHEEGYYIVMNLELDASKVKDFEKYLKLQNDILRYLLIREDKL